MNPDSRRLAATIVNSYVTQSKGVFSISEEGSFGLINAVASALERAAQPYVKGFDDGVEEGRRIERSLRVLFAKPPLAIAQPPGKGILIKVEPV